MATYLQCRKCGKTSWPGPATCEQCGTSLKDAYSLTRAGLAGRAGNSSASAILVLLAVLALFGGTVLMSQVSAGAGVVGIACCLAIFARMSQASAHHKILLAFMESSDPQPKAAPASEPALVLEPLSKEA